ncbi:pyocin knob domain-containing protein [Pseudomonas sp. M5A4_2d]
MARQEINLGAMPTGMGGDTPRSANMKINAMTQELFSRADALGTAALGTLTTSTDDHTPGRVVRVGDFGVGAVKSIVEADLDGLRAVGTYYSMSGVNTPNVTNGWVTVHEAGRGYTLQEFVGIDGSKWVRIETAGVWQPWQKVLTDGPGLASTQQRLGLKSRAFQADGERLLGQNTAEAGKANGGLVSSLTIHTTMPYSESASPLIRCVGCINGYTSPFTLDLSWYYYQGSFNSGVALLNSASPAIGSLQNVPPLKVSVYRLPETGLMSIYIGFPGVVYLPRFAMYSIQTGAIEVSAAYTLGWTTVADIAPPTTAMNMGALTVITTLNTANCARQADGLIKAI